MFTGLVEGIGTLVKKELLGKDARMGLKPEYRMEDIRLGESIAVDGACLTVTHFDASLFVVDVSAETLRRTTLGAKPLGSRCNLERALRVGDRLGGHWVTGHVDAIGRIVGRSTQGRSIRLTLEVPPSLSLFIVEKGSITVNGVSLTVNACKENRFEVNIVPHTADVTTIRSLRPGDDVNIETDILGKYIHKMLSTIHALPSDSTPSSSLDLSFLARHGFI